MNVSRFYYNIFKQMYDYDHELLRFNFKSVISLNIQTYKDVMKIARTLIKFVHFKEFISI